jgi:hypothetical protein
VQLRFPGESNPYYLLTGLDITPQSERWVNATVPERRAYFALLATELAKWKDHGLASGVDCNGARLARIRPRTWEERRRKYAVWTGPPLTPQYEDSRTRRLHRVRATQDGRIVGIWPKRWGKILRHHAQGNPRKNLPVRDVIGLDPKREQRAIASARRKWAARHRAIPRPAPRPMRIAPAAFRVPPAPKAPPRPRPAPVPRPAAAPAPGPTAAELLGRYPFLRQFNPTDPLARPAPPRGGAVGRFFRRVAAAFTGLFG